MESKYPRPKVIAVDVDDTLIVDGMLNLELIEWLRGKADDHVIMLWSMAGMVHAENVAKDAGCYDLFDIILPKPGYIVDDDGWNWTRYTEVMDEKLNVKAESSRPSGQMLRSRRNRKRSKL